MATATMKYKKVKLKDNFTVKKKLSNFSKQSVLVCF